MPPVSRVGEALDGIGYRGAEPVAQRKLGAFVELHIEQGPLLEAENKTIGVVDRGQGITWYDGTITGFESHAGTTPMPLRKDALAALAEFVLAVERDCKSAWPERGRHRRRGRDRGALAQRDPRRNRLHRRLSAVRMAETLAAIDTDLRAAIAEIAARRKVEIDARPRSGASRRPSSIQNWSTRSRTPPKRSATAIAASPPAPAMTPATSPIVVPAAMIFVPCKDGVSHNELEDATQADCTAGANVLMHTVLALAGVAS